MVIIMTSRQSHREFMALTAPEANQGVIKQYRFMGDDRATKPPPLTPPVPVSFTRTVTH